MDSTTELPAATARAPRPASNLHTGATPPTGTAAAVAFLRDLDPTGRHNLIAIHPETETLEGRTFSPAQWEKIAFWIEKRRGERNIYYSLNEPIADAPHNKLRKEHIGRIRAIGVDIDPNKRMESEPGGFDAERKRIADLVEAAEQDPIDPPAFSIDSGGGMQMLWTLAPTLDAGDPSNVAWAEGMGRTLKKKFGGDAIQSIEHILRLPVTINHPDKKKRARGRREAPAVLRFTSLEGATSCADLEAAFGPPMEAPESSGASPAAVAAVEKQIDMGLVRQAATYGELPDDLRRRFEYLRKREPSVDALWRGDRSARPGDDDSGSGFTFALAGALKQAGDFTPTEFGQLLYVWDYSSGPDKIDARYIARAWANSIQPWKRATAEEEFEPVEVSDRRPKSERGKLWFDLLPDIEPGSESTFLIEGWFDLGAMIVTYGESGSGKTNIALSQSFAIATGQEWAGRETTPGLVVYVAAEGSRGIRKRVKAWRLRIGDKAPFALVPCPVDLLRPTGDTRALIDLVKEAERKTGSKCVMVVIDTLSRALAGGNENGPEDMGALVKHCDAIRLATGATIHVIHHSGKNPTAGARGHSLLRAATDTEIEIDAGKVTATKQRDMDDRRPPLTFTYETVELGTDRRGKPITTVLPLIGAAVEFEPKFTEEEKLALDALEHLVADRVDPSSHAKGKKADISSTMAAIGIRTSEWKSAFRVRQKSGGSASTFRRTYKALERQGLVTRVGALKTKEILWKLPMRQSAPGKTMTH